MTDPTMTPEMMRAGTLAVEAITGALEGITDTDALQDELFEKRLQGEFVAALIGIAGASLKLLADCQGVPLAQVTAMAGACYAQRQP